MNTAHASAVPSVMADHLVNRTRLSSVVMTLMGAALVGVLAQVSIPVGPVPVTGQTLGVMLVGALLGRHRGAASMVTYLMLGVAGMPWFADGTGGGWTVMKPSFGFIVGFIPAAYVIGYLCEKQWDRHPMRALAAFGAASLIPFVTGVPSLWAVLAWGGQVLSFTQLIAVGITPFLIGGVIKWLLGTAILPGAWSLIRHWER